MEMVSRDQVVVSYMVAAILEQNKNMIFYKLLLELMFCLKTIFFYILETLKNLPIIG